MAFLGALRERPHRKSVERIHCFFSQGSQKSADFWEERRHMSPNDARIILCDLVAEREVNSTGTLDGH
jgi:hypothetical protein